MVADDNGVNIKRRRYHHGDLRRVLIEEGLRLLAERDAEALSLRGVARAAGVSATAVYRHFPDKEALMTALALEGIRRLGAVQRMAVNEDVSDRPQDTPAATRAKATADASAFAATGRAYVRFALANPALFRLIFTSPALAKADGPPGDDNESLAMLRESAALLALQQDRPAGVVAVRSWALVHGLAMLMLDGRLPPDDSLIEQTIGA